MAIPDKTILELTRQMEEQLDLTVKGFELTKESNSAFQSVMAAYLALVFNLARNSSLDLPELSQTITEMSASSGHGRVGKEFLSALSVALSQMQKDFSSTAPN